MVFEAFQLFFVEDEHFGDVAIVVAVADPSSGAVFEPIYPSVCLSHSLCVSLSLSQSVSRSLCLSLSLSRSLSPCVFLSLTLCVSIEMFTIGFHLI